MNFPKSDYKEYPKTLAPDDLWGQVRRTVGGKPVSEAQIQLIVAAIRAGLDLQRDDQLLDIACGNGALSAYFFDDCACFNGIDFSEYLIAVANRHFAQPPRISFEVNDAASHVLQEADPGRYTKVLCYGSFSYFSDADAHTVLSTLAERYTHVRRVFIGNLPDRARANLFYPPGKDYAAELDDPAAAIGLWRDAEDWQQLAARTGWTARFHHMPKDFYAAHYRYDVVLER